MLAQQREAAALAEHHRNPAASETTAAHAINVVVHAMEAASVDYLHASF
jgi:hypothetical protein